MRVLDWRRLPVGFNERAGCSAPVSLGDLLATLGDREITARNLVAILDGDETLLPEEEARLAISEDETALATELSVFLFAWELALWAFSTTLVDSERVAFAVLRARLDGREPTAGELAAFYGAQEQRLRAGARLEEKRARLDDRVATVHAELAKRYRVGAKPEGSP